MDVFLSDSYEKVNNAGFAGLSYTALNWVEQRKD